MSVPVSTPVTTNQLVTEPPSTEINTLYYDAEVQRCVCVCMSIVCVWL